MLWTVFRTVDMQLGLTMRGRLARGIVTSIDMDPALAYEGAVNMQIDDWLPELCCGEPPHSAALDAEFHVAQTNAVNERIHGYCCRYDRRADSWCDENGRILAPRGATDRWVLAADHNAAFARAARRARARTQAQLSSRGPLALMLRYGLRGIPAEKN